MMSKMVLGVTIFFLLLVATVLLFSQRSAPKTTSTLVLTKSQPTTLLGTTIQMTVTALNIPPKGCRDCIAGASILLQKDNQKQTVTFRIGGIAGVMEREKEAFGYVFKLANLTETSVTITYEPK